MAVYVLLEFDDDKQAQNFVKDTITSDVVSWFNEKAQLENARSKVRAVFKKPTLFCECVSGSKLEQGGSSRGKKYGWWVHSKCGKPRRFWAEGDQWYALGTNLLPLALLERMGLPAEKRPAGWKSEHSWTFLLDDAEHDWDYKIDGTKTVRWCYDHNQLLDTCREGNPE
jgi:hypothetical protein